MAKCVKAHSTELPFAGLCKSSATRGEVPPRFGNFRKLGGRRGGFFFKNYKFYMTHFGLIKLESSNLLDITILMVIKL